MKLLHARGLEDPGLVDRFLREAQLASRLDHPYAAHVYAFGAEPDGLLWIAMERVRGTSLAQVLASQPERRMPLHRFVHLLELICEVVHVAHEQGIVHRDLKPSNIMVLARAGRLLPKLLDFGVAKRIGEPELAQPGAHLGSPLYMAPEQWTEHGAVDARADVYALGVLAFEALTGRVPFTGRTVGEIARQHVTAEVPALPADLPAALAPVLRGALAKQPADRPASALAFAEALRVAAGVNLSADALPRLDVAVRQEAAWLPQPIADAVAGFETARNPHQARDALWKIVHVAVRYLGVVALAACSRGGPGGAIDSPVVVALVRELHRRDLADEDWLDLVGALVRSSTAARDAYPIPELVDLIAGSGAGSGDPVFAALLAARAEEAASTTEASVRDRLVAYLPQLTRLLRALAFLADYQLVVPRATGGEVWMGPRRARRPWIAIAPDLAVGSPILVDFDGRPVLQLAPLIQSAAPTPGAAEELFLFAGGRRDLGRGARLVAEPHGFERLDDAVWDWFRAHLLDFDEAAPQQLERAPYRGLSSFTESDAGMFFGRERAADAFANQLLLQPLVAVVGPSGAGKSSFVQAGVLPRLPIGWRALVFRPGAAPRAALAARTELPAALATEGDPAAVAAHLRERTGEQTLVLVVDQFEEIFTLCRDAAEQTRFAEVLVQAARSVDDRVRVILTLRDDFLVRAGELAPLRDRLAQGLTLLATPALDDLVRVVVEPARQAGYRFDDAELPLAMARAVAGQPGALALLSFTAARLWELRDRHFQQLTRKAYAAIGGVEGALAGHAEATLLACATDQQRLVREVFRHLVTAEGTRAVLGRDELIAALGGVHGAAVIERLVAARLLVAAESERGGEQIEIVHEALLTSWPRLVEWQREDAASARLRDQLRIAAQQWHERGRPRGLLWRGEALEDYRRWRTQWPGAIPTTDLAFATASLDDDARGHRVRRAIAASAMSLLLAGIAALAVMYRSSSHHAEAAHDRLIASYEEQGRRLLLDGEYLRALPYLAEAYDQGDESTAVRFLLARAERLASAELAVHVHSGHARAAAFRRDRIHILSVSDDGEAAIWDASTGHVVAALPGHPGGPYYGKVSRDGDFAAIPLLDGIVLWDGVHTRTIAAGRADRIAIDARGTRIAVASGGEVSAWNPVTGERIWTASLQMATTLVAWSGGAVVAVGVDRRVRVVDDHGVALLPTSGPVDAMFVAASGPIATVSGASVELWDATGVRRSEISGRSKISAAALTPDASRIALGGGDGIVRLYDTATGASLGELVGHHGGAVSIEFSDDARRLATAGSDLTVRIWDLADHHPITRLLGARDRYVAGTLRFDATGQRLVAPGWDGAIRVFATADPDIETSVDTGEDADTGQFFDGGKRFVTSGAHALRVWSTATGAPLGHLDTQGTLARISPDGTKAAIVITGTADAEIRDVATGAVSARLHGSGHLQWASFDHASERVVTTSDDHGIEIWGPRGERLVTLRGHSDNVLMAAFSPDDQHLVSASADWTARIWEIASGREIGQVKGGDVMASVEFDAAGARLLTANADRLARLWDLATLAPIRSFEHPSPVRFATIGTDHALIAGAAADGTVSVWDAATSSLLAQFHHAATAECVAFTPNGDYLLSTSTDHRAIVWRLGSETRSSASVTTFVRCHAPYRLVETRLEAMATECRIH